MPPVAEWPSRWAVRENKKYKVRRKEIRNKRRNEENKLCDVLKREKHEI